VDKGVTVIGNAVLDVDPDHARLRFEIVERRPSLPAALNGAERRSGELRSAMDRFRAVISRESVTRLWSRPRREYRGQEYVHVGYEAGYGIEVDVSDLDQAGALIDAAVDAANTDVTGPVYLVDDDNPVWDQVRRLAAEDARRRAIAFAGGLGARLGPPLSVSDPRLLTGGDRRDPHVLYEAAAPSMDDPGGFNLEGSVTVSSEICVTFSLELG